MEDPELTLTSSHYVTLGMCVHVHTRLPPVVWSLHLHPSMIMGLDGPGLMKRLSHSITAMGTAQPSSLNLLCRCVELFLRAIGNLCV